MSTSPTAGSCVACGSPQMPELPLCCHLCPRAEESLQSWSPESWTRIARMDVPPVLPHSSPLPIQGSVILFGIWISFLGKCKCHKSCEYPQEGTGDRDTCWHPSSLPSTALGGVGM